MACVSYRPRPALLRQSLELLSCFGIWHLRVLCLLLLPPPWSYTCKPLCLAFILWFWRLNLRPSWLPGKHLTNGTIPLPFKSFSDTNDEDPDINTKQCHLFFLFSFCNTRGKGPQLCPLSLYPLLWSLIRFWTWETGLDGSEGLARPCLIFPASSNQERAGPGSWCTSDRMPVSWIRPYTYMCAHAFVYLCKVCTCV